MNYQEFINEYYAKSFDYDGVSGVQCVDLIKMYLDKVFGIKPSAWGNAKDYYENLNNLPIKNYFTRIPNTIDLIPQKGDICVWGTGLGNKYGHISIADGIGTTKQFYSYDLNWGGKTVRRVLHNYTGFLGVLRPNDQTKIEGDEEMKTYQNGSIEEPVYADTNCTDKIGSLNPREKCDCYGIFNDRAVVRYKVDGTENYKIGFCKWTGGVQ